MRANEFITEHRLVFKRNQKTGSISMKWRCESGPRKNKTVPELSQCSASPDIKKSAKMKQTRQRTKVAQARKTKKTKRVNPMTKTATRLNKQMRKGLREDVFTVTEFKMNVFENLSQYRRWVQSPKDSKRGMTRHYVDRYETLVRNELAESTSSFNTHKKEATAFSKAFKAMDERDGVNIEVGESISVLSTVVVPSDKTSHIEVSGFVKPKQIAKINLDTDNKIDTIEFSDGSIFPEAAEFTTVGGVNITNTTFFPDYTSASKAYTALWMMLTSMEGKGWKVENYMSK